LSNLSRAQVPGGCGNRDRFGFAAWGGNRPRVLCSA
jgi:hypothetical protein